MKVLHKGYAGELPYIIYEKLYKEPGKFRRLVYRVRVYDDELTTPEILVEVYTGFDKRGSGYLLSGYLHTRKPTPQELEMLRRHFPDEFEFLFGGLTLPCL